MKSKFFRPLLMLSLVLPLLGTQDGCPNNEVRSASGTKMATAGNVHTDEHGHTAEQANIIHKVKVESDMDKVWYLYVLSPTNKHVILKSTAKGKITSSGKRLTPKEISGVASAGNGMSFQIGETTYYTQEMPAEDGTFGSSAEYIFWTDTAGVNHRHYLLDGQVIHVADQEMSIREFFAED